MAQGSSCQTTRFPLFYFALFFMSVCSVPALSAQEDDTRVVSGTVVNEKSEVVVAATVSAQLLHAQRTATTDNQGNFLLRMPAEAMTLTVSGPSIANFQQTLAASAPSQGLRLQVQNPTTKPPQLSGTVVDTSGAADCRGYRAGSKRERYCTNNDPVGHERLLRYFWTPGRRLSTRGI